MCLCAGEMSKYMMIFSQIYSKIIFTPNALHSLLISVTMATPELSLNTWKQSNCYSFEKVTPIFPCKLKSNALLYYYLKKQYDYVIVLLVMVFPLTLLYLKHHVTLHALISRVQYLQ